MRVLRHRNSEDAREAATLILQTTKSKTLDPQVWDELAARYGTEGAAATVAAEAMVFASALSVNLRILVRKHE